MMVPFKGVCEPKFMKFWDDVEDPLYFLTSLLIVCIVFHSKDIRH